MTLKTLVLDRVLLASPDDLHNITRGLLRAGNSLTGLWLGFVYLRGEPGEGARDEKMKDAFELFFRSLRHLKVRWRCGVGGEGYALCLFCGGLSVEFDASEQRNDALFFYFFFLLFSFSCTKNSGNQRTLTRLSLFNNNYYLPP